MLLEPLAEPPIHDLLHPLLDLAELAQHLAGFAREPGAAPALAAASRVDDLGLQPFLHGVDVAPRPAVGNAHPCCCLKDGAAPVDLLKELFPAGP